jgi:hypothetical protein
MPEKKCKCPHCGKDNVYTEPSWDKAFAENLPGSIAKAIGVTVVTILTGGLGGLLAGGIVYADSVVRYLDGVSMACGSCGRQFKVS